MFDFATDEGIELAKETSKLNTPPHSLIERIIRFKGDFSTWTPNIDRLQDYNFHESEL